MTERLRIIVAGMVGLYPVGGVAWDYLQYVIGLARLGHDVYYHEDTWSWPYQPVAHTYTNEGIYSADFIGTFFERHAPDLADRWHYQHLDDQSFGMSRSAFDEVAKTCDVFLNVSGGSRIPEVLPGDCRKVFVDTDPGYNQIVYLERFDWSENVDRWCDLVDAHDVHFTYAENIGEPDCLIPETGFDWIPTRMPVVTDLWEVTEPPPQAPWTTVMTWNAFKGSVTHGEREYFSKGREFESLLDLPERVSVPLHLALGGVDVPTDRVEASGWTVVDAPSRTLTSDSYQGFLRGSRGEVSTAKHIYVALSTGWFSTRSACYLAAGRPVVVQDTGFTTGLPRGEGIVAFSTPDEAAAGIDAIERDYPAHSAAARVIAEDHFDVGNVLPDLLGSAMAGSR